MSDQGDLPNSKKPPTHPPGWNDPPPLDPQACQPVRRPHLTRRVAFPLGQGSPAKTDNQQTDASYANVAQILNSIFEKHQCPENIRRQMDSMQLRWSAPGTSEHVRKSFYEMIQHINENRLEEALMINTQLTSDSSAMYFTLFVRTLLDFLQK